MKIRWVEAELSHADGRTDGYDAYRTQSSGTSCCDE